MQVSSVVTRLRQEASHAYITSTDHDPSRKSWDKSVNQALERIKGDYSLLKKVLDFFVSMQSDHCVLYSSIEE